MNSITRGPTRGPTTNVISPENIPGKFVNKKLYYKKGVRFMKRKVILSTILSLVLMFNCFGAVMAANTEEPLTPVEETEIIPVSEPETLPEENTLESDTLSTEEETPLVNEIPTEEENLSSDIPETSPSNEETSTVPKENAPMLAASNTWYKSSTAKSTFTTINIVDSADAETIATATESWSAAADADGDGTLNDDIMCYVNGTTLTIAGNGSGSILMNPNSSKVFGDKIMDDSFGYVTTFLNVNLLDTSKVTDMSYMFGQFQALTSLDLSHFDTRNVTNMEYMFSTCLALTSLDLSHFDTRNVTNMTHMFMRCKALTSLDLSHFDTSKVTDMSSMFYSCSRLKTINFSNWDTSNVTNMAYMFSCCSSFTSLDLSHFDTSNVTDMNSMFNECSRLKTINLSNWDTAKVSNMQQMFSRCEFLTSLDLSHFDTSNVTNMNAMFGRCFKLTELNVSNFDTTNAGHMSAFANNCSSLTTIVLGENFGHVNNELDSNNLRLFAWEAGLDTIVYGANDIMKAYDWDGRNVTFKTEELEDEGESDSNTIPEETPSVSTKPSKKPSSGGGGGGGGSTTDKVNAPKANNTNKEVVIGTAIELSTTTNNAKIYYTTNGSTPTTASALYTEPITLTEDTTIKMIAVKDKMDDSSVVTVSYNVRKATINSKKDADKIAYMGLRQDNKFMPDEAATRYEIITALDNLFDIEKTDVVKEFKDVENANAELVSLFSGASIINGYPDGTFGGEKGITRAEFIKILTIMLNLDEAAEGTAGLNDIDGHWGKDYITRFVNQGYIKGYPDGTFRPDNNITRAEAVTIINRIINASDKDSVVSEDVAENHWAYNEIQNAMIVNK